jgi:hypothetical protein
MMQTPAILVHSQNVADTPQQTSYMQQTPQQTSYTQQEPHQNYIYMLQISILPQQPNYTIHISQAATTNRAETQRADFSVAERSTDSDDNDDRLSGLEVSGSCKKRTGSRTISDNNEKKTRGKKQTTIELK